MVLLISAHGGLQQLKDDYPTIYNWRKRENCKRILGVKGVK
jgi:hypothetical protein